MSYIYVRNDGTATGDGGLYATIQTGDWDATFTATTQFYATVKAALGATSFAIGDVICVSDIHSHDYGSVLTTFDSTSRTSPSFILSVDDTAIDAQKFGAFEDAIGAAGSFNFSSAWLIMGMSLRCGDNLAVSNTDASVRFVDCKLEVTAASSVLGTTGLDGFVEYIDCELKLGNATAYMRFGMKNKIIGGSVTGVGQYLCDNAAPYDLEVRGCDLSSITDYLFGGYGGNAADSTYEIHIHGCKLHATLTGFMQENPLVLPGTMVVTDSGNTAALAAHQYYETGVEYEIEDSVVTTRDESTDFEGVSVSLKVVTDHFWSHNFGVVLDKFSRYMELSDVTSDTARIYFTCANALTDQNVYAELLYKDGASNELSVMATTRPDRLATAVTHTTDATSTWTSGLTNKYQMDIDTSAVAGKDGVGFLRIYVEAQNETIFFDTTVDMVA